MITKMKDLHNPLGDYVDTYGSIRRDLTSCLGWFTAVRCWGRYVAVYMTSVKLTFVDNRFSAVE